VERLPDGDHFRLGMKLFELGQIVQKNLDIREIALPSIEYLSETFHETVNLAIRDGTEIIYIEILESNQTLRMAASRLAMTSLDSLGKASGVYGPTRQGPHPGTNKIP
jgi:DNA-binding IclR family transcriptional regulator